MEIKKGDSVKILSGKDKGKTGKVLRALREKSLVVVEGVNIRKKHSKPKKQGQKGQIVEMPAAVKSSSVQIVCQSCKKSVRIGQKMEGTKKVRVCKKCGANL